MKIREILAGMLMVMGMSGSAMAQAFPEHSIRVVVPYAPGGTSDVLARMLQPALNKASGQSFVVDNRAGGASVIGTRSVASAAPDGYTLLVGDTSLFVNPSLLKSLPYDTAKDFRGVTMLARSPLYLLVNAKHSAKTLADLIAYAKAHPGELTYSSGGYGSSPHMVGEMFKLAAGVDITHVPYQGGAPAVQALLAGQVDMYFGGSTAAPQISAGKMRALAVGGGERDQLLPEVPTFKEAGVAGMEDAYTYWGIFAPAAVPNDRVQTLSQYFHQAMKSPEFTSMLPQRGLSAVPNTPEEHTRQMNQMIADWKKVVEQGGIRTDK